MRTRITTLLIVALIAPALAASAQTLILADHNRETASYQWDMMNPGATNPWGDYSDPMFGTQMVTTCMNGGTSETTSYGTPPEINLGPIYWTQSCFTKGNLEADAPSGPIPMDLMPNMGDFASTYTFDGLAASDLAPGTGSDVLIFAFDLPGDVLDPAYCEGATTELAIGQANGDDADDFTYVPGSAFPDDYFGGSSRINTVRIDNCELSSIDYFVTVDGVQSFPGNTLAAVGSNGRGGSIISGMTRISDGLTEYRPTIFHTNQSGNFDASIVGHVWPTNGMYWAFGDVVCLVDVPQKAATTTVTVAETTTSPTEAASTTVAPPTTVVETTATTVAASADDGGGLSPILIFILLLLIAFLIWWFFFRPRTEQRRIDPGPTRVRTGKPPVSSVPRDRETPHECDWSLYLIKASGEEQLRGPKPDAHECCVYKVQVTSFVHDDTHVVKERQDLAEVGRERASTGRSLVAGQDTDLRLGVRSWPYGEQGSMHGLGDMSEWPIVGPTPGPWPEYWQEKQFEEQLDTAYTATLRQETRVRVVFTDGCGGSTHDYTYDSNSTAVIHRTFECTNENNSPTCPVELTAAATTRVAGKGDLDYVVDATSHTDVDELPIKIAITGVNAEFRRADADSHRHDAGRDRDVWEIRDSGVDNGVKRSKKWESIVENHVEAHTGMLIPQAMWPTTDRVTTYMEMDTATKFELGGEADTGHAPSSDCCADGGASCLCSPSFQLVVGAGNWAKLTVDGAVRLLANSDTTSTTQTIFWE